MRKQGGKVILEISARARLLPERNRRRADRGSDPDQPLIRYLDTGGNVTEMHREGGHWG